MTSSYIYKPSSFFGLVFFVIWVSGFTAAYLSYQAGTQLFQLALILLGMIGTFISAMIMIYGLKENDLIRSFWS